MGAIEDDGLRNRRPIAEIGRVVVLEVRADEDRLRARAGRCDGWSGRGRDARLDGGERRERSRRPGGEAKLSAVRRRANEPDRRRRARHRNRGPDVRRVGETLARPADSDVELGGENGRAREQHNRSDRRRAALPACARRGCRRARARARRGSPCAARAGGARARAEAVVLDALTLDCAPVPAVVDRSGRAADAVDAALVSAADVTAATLAPAPSDAPVVFVRLVSPPFAQLSATHAPVQRMRPKDLDKSNQARAEAISDDYNNPPAVAR